MHPLIKPCIPALLLCAVLAACGGGDDDDDNVTVSPPPPPPPTAVNASCPALSAGSYWSIEPARPGNLDRIIINTSTGAISSSGGVATGDVLVPVAGQPCRFGVRVNGVTNNEQVAVSPSGIGFSRFAAGTGFEGAIFFPAQTVPLSELAGNWNFVGYEQDAAFVPLNGSFTVSAAGLVTNALTFVGSTQEGNALSFMLAARSDGSFNVVENGVTDARERFFAHRAPNNVVTLFYVGIGDPTTRGVLVARKQQSLTIPAVGTVRNFFDTSINATTVAEILNQSITVTSVTATTETRIRASNNQVDTFTYNNPRPGMTFRANNSCTTGVGGPALACPAALVLDSQGTGITFSTGAVNNSFFSVALGRP